MIATIDKVTAATVHRYLKSKAAREYFWIAEVDGAMWATDSHIAIPATTPQYPATNPLADLFAKYNLTPEPGSYDIGQTITRGTLDPPEIRKLIPDLNKCTQIAPAEIGGQPVATLIGGRWIDLYDADNPTGLDRERRLIVEASAGPDGDWWRKDGLCVYFRDGKVAGLLMSVRLGS